jgi:hypothetical protein
MSVWVSCHAPHALPHAPSPSHIPNQHVPVPCCQCCPLCTAHTTNMPLPYMPEMGGVAHLCWLPQHSLVAAVAAAADPCERLKRRTCTRRRNGRCRRNTACSWRRTCAALSCARAMVLLGKSHHRSCNGAGTGSTESWEGVVPAAQARKDAAITVGSHFFTHQVRERRWAA